MVSTDNRPFKRLVGFVMRWYSNSVAMIRVGDPLLMGAAIAYNTLFAMFPLALAFFTILTFFDVAGDAYTRAVTFINAVFPPELAEFFTKIVGDSAAGAVSDDRVVLVVIAILVALWSGSRAVYAIQKSLRVVQGLEETRGYVRTRLTGIVVTIAGGASLVVAYIAILVGSTAWEDLADLIGFGSVGVAQVIVVVAAFGWIFLLLWVIYRFGPPEPFGHAATSAVLVTVIIMVGSWAAGQILPKFDLSFFAVFGTVGLVLVWLYCIGIVLVAIPVAVVGFFAAVDDHTQR